MIRIQYLSQNENNSAGYRLRAKRVAELLVSKGACIASFSNKLFTNASVVVISKKYGMRFIMMAALHKILGKKIIYDLCDIIQNGDGGIPTKLNLMCRIADIVTVSSFKIAEKLYYSIPSLEVEVIDDIAESVDFVEIPEGRITNAAKTVLYFGNELNTGKRSYSLLRPYAENLPIDSEMVICSNNRAEFHKEFSGVDRVRYYEWSPELFTELIAVADVVILPFCQDEKSLARSSNRLTLALAAGKLVLATPIPSYARYHECYLELNKDQFSSIMSKSKKEIECMSGALTGQFSAQRHNADIISSWEAVFKRLV